MGIAQKVMPSSVNSHRASASEWHHVKGCSRLLSPVVILRRLLPTDGDYCRRNENVDGSPLSPRFDFPGFTVADLNREHKRNALSTRLSVNSEDVSQVDGNAVSIKEEPLEISGAYALKDHPGEQSRALIVHEEIPIPHGTHVLKDELNDPLKHPAVKREPSPSLEPHCNETQPSGLALEPVGSNRVSVSEHHHMRGCNRLLSRVTVLRSLPSAADYYCRPEDVDGSPPSPPFDFQGFTVADLNREHQRTAPSTKLSINTEDASQVGNNTISIKEESLELHGTYALEDDPREQSRALAVEEEITERYGIPVLKSEVTDLLKHPAVEREPSPSLKSSSTRAHPSGPALQRGHHAFQCDSCEFSCEIRRVLERHVKRRHGRTSGPLSGHTLQQSWGDKPSEVDTSDVVSSHSIALNTFAQRVPGQNKRPNARVSTGECPLSCNRTEKSSLYTTYITHSREDAGKRPFVCVICDSRFSQNVDLVRHLRVHSGELFACFLCDAKFSRKTSLVKHLRTHADEYPFVCDVCDEGFAGEADLVEHLRQHTGERSFACDVCDERFSSKTGVVDHLRQHSTGGRPFGCDICGETFVNKIILAVHSRAHTDEDSLACFICGKMFPKEDASGQTLPNKSKRTPVCMSHMW